MTMKELSQGIKCEISFSRRFTLHQIWAELDKKYPSAKNIRMRKDDRKSV
jgi:hypothetical protein